MRENKQLLFRMSEADYDQLTTLSADFGLTRNEYLRTMIRINYLVREYSNGNTKAKYRNDFGLELPEGMIESIMKQMLDYIPNMVENIEVKMAKQKANVWHKKTMSKPI